MQKGVTRRRLLGYLIAMVWIANGLFCKVVGLVPRHQAIVARIIGNAHAGVFTKLIGFSEIAMAVWILSGFKLRLNAVTQVIVIATMNTIEFVMAPDLLLWGRFNAVFAALFCLLILVNAFYQDLKNHPFAVEAFFESSLVLSFAIPKEQVRSFIPECLELDTFNDKWAFIAVAMVETKSLRPKGFPKMLGKDFFLIGYRVFVRFTNQAGKNLRGLYILKSETDKKMMEFFGNIFTHYKYTTTDIEQKRQDGRVEISSHRSGFKVMIRSSGGGDIGLPAESPFADWKEARRFAGPLPFTFTYDEAEKKVLIIEGVRENWKPMPVEVVAYDFSFLEELKLSGARLANAFMIGEIPYYWKKGKIEPWK